MLKMNATKTDDYFIVGLDDSGKPGIGLQAGQTCSVVSADPATVVITPDATPRATTADFTLPDGTLVPAGTQAIASGKVAAANPVAQPNVPINVAAHLANADGTPVLDDTNVAVPDQVDTVTIVPNLLKSEGILFGTPA
jgi:hypothetical protein